MPVTGKIARLMRTCNLPRGLGICASKLKLPVLVAVILAAVWTGAGQCDDLPSLPAPSGFVELSGLIPTLKDLALLGQATRKRLIGVYIRPDELAPVLRGAPVAFTIVCRAYVNEEFSSEDDAKASFIRMVAAAKREESKKFDLTDPDVRRIIEHFADATKER